MYQETALASGPGAVGKLEASVATRGPMVGIQPHCLGGR
jgi:hypothetical protein